MDGTWLVSNDALLRYAERPLVATKSLGAACAPLADPWYDMNRAIAHKLAPLFMPTLSYTTSSPTRYERMIRSVRDLKTVPCRHAFNAWDIIQNVCPMPGLPYMSVMSSRSGQHGILDRRATHSQLTDLTRAMIEEDKRMFHGGSR